MTTESVMKRDAFKAYPNPLLVENREATAQAVRESGADFGIAWDGDFDRCFLFDEQGEFIEGYYIVLSFLGAKVTKGYEECISEECVLDG